MELDTLQVAVRQRGHWESIDLGCLMARRWWRMLIVAWSVFALPVIMLSAVLVPAAWTMFVVWWFKPLFERLPLYMLSKAIFGEVTTIRAALRDYRQWLLPGLLAALTITRLSPNRSFFAPVTTLEGLPRSERGPRFQILSRSAGTAAGWLTLLGVHVETFLYAGVIVLTMRLVPTQVDVDWWSLMVGVMFGEWLWFSAMVYFLVLALVAPFYVACGFSLYLNRRIELEAWDIELGFLRIIRRATVCLAAVGLLFAAAPGHAQDETAAQTTGPAAQSKVTIDEVLAGEDFHQISTASVPLFLKEFFERESDPEVSQDPPDFGWLGVLVRAIAGLAEFALWTGVVILVLWLLYRFRLWEYLPQGGSGQRGAQAPRTVLGFDITAEALPSDVPGEAERLWAAGHEREALALLYRATLVVLVREFNCDFRESDTEEQCLGKAKARTDRTMTEFFATLTLAWQRLAYRHEVLDDANFAVAVENWRSVFEVETR